MSGQKIIDGLKEALEMVSAPTDNLEAGAGDLVERWTPTIWFPPGHNGEAAGDMRRSVSGEYVEYASYSALAAQLAAVTAERDAALDKNWVSFPAYEAALKAGRDFRDRATIAEAENARLRERIEQAYKAGFDFAMKMMDEAPK